MAPLKWAMLQVETFFFCMYKQVKSTINQKMFDLVNIQTDSDHEGV